jgi:hypothetical protein
MSISSVVQNELSRSKPYYILRTCVDKAPHRQLKSRVMMKAGPAGFHSEIRLVSNHQLDQSFDSVTILFQSLISPVRTWGGLTHEVFMITKQLRHSTGATGEPQERVLFVFAGTINCPRDVSTARSLRRPRPRAGAMVVGMDGLP